MKTIHFILPVLAAVFFAFPVAAQTAPADGASSGAPKVNVYYVNLPLEKVYPHRLGYLVLYRKGGSELGQVYLPSKWFTQSAGKGALVNLPVGPDWPYLSVYYVDGVFSHVRLFVASSYAHQSWGHIPSTTVNLDEKFNVDDLKIEY